MKTGYNARVLAPVFQLEVPPMIFSHLTGNEEPDSAPPRFGCEEGHEQILGGGQSRPFVQDLDDHEVLHLLPADPHRSLVGSGGFHRISQKVDQGLLDLGPVRLNDDVRALL